MALLAAYAKNRQPGEQLEDYLEKRVFAGTQGSTVEPDPQDVEGFRQFLGRYTAGLAVERAAVEAVK